MISVTHNDGRCEPLVNIQNCEIEEEVNGAFTLSFASFFVNNPGYDLLEEEAIIDLVGQEFRMIDLDQKRLSKSVAGNHVFFDLNHHLVEGIQGGTRYAEEQAAFILAGSGWTWEVQGDIPPQLFLDAFGNDNAIKLIRLMCETLKCEVQIMPNKHLIFAKEIGQDSDFQFRSRHNIKDITRSVTTSDLCTAIKVTGGNGLEKEYRAPTWELYAINGKPRYADPVTNEEMTSEESLLKFAEQELGDRWMPQISIDVSIAEMNAQGYQGTPGLGDRVWLIEESMGLLFQTRVMKRKGSPFRKDKMIITLANMKPSFTDVLVETKVEIDKNAREFRSKIEQVRDRITLEVSRLNGDVLEAYSRIELQADRITSEVARLDGDIVAANSKITQTAESIVSEVNRIDKDIGTANSRITQLSDSVTIQINQVNKDLSAMDTQVQITAGEVSSKVSQTDFNGVEVMSRINQTASAVTINANKINMLGITEVFEKLYIGGNWRDSREKAIMFRGSGGGVAISSPAIDQLRLEASSITLAGSTYFNGYVSFANATVSNLNADTVDGYHASSFTKSWLGQDISFEFTAGGQMRVYISGVHRFTFTGSVV